MNLIPEEQILIKDIFAVSLNPQDSSGLFLRDFPKEISHLGSGISLVQHTTYFDSLLMERLQFPATEVLAYLEDCLARSSQAMDKPWNSGASIQKFINYSIEIIKNFIFLSLQEPDLFSEQLDIDPESNKTPDKMLSIAMKLMTHFERRGFNPELLQVIHPKIEKEVEGDFAETFIEVLLARQRFQTILDTKVFIYLGLLTDLLSIPAFKAKFLNLRKAKFIPAELNKLEGCMMDNQSPFGLFSRLSILGTTAGYYHQESEVNMRFEERLLGELGSERINKDKIKAYSNIQNEFTAKLTQNYKVLLKKDSKDLFLRWHYALIISNRKKMQLGSRLQNANNSTLSHDGHVINIYACLLNLCKVILRREEHKYESIDPQYFIHNDRMQHCKYEVLNKKAERKQKMCVEKEFGTITQFFFLCLQFLNIGVIPAQDNFVELVEYKEKIEREKAKYATNPHLLRKIQVETEKAQARLMRYVVVLLDDSLITSTIKLFEMVMFLLPRWLQFDYDQLCDGVLAGYKPNELTAYLPQFLLESIYKFHITNFKFKPNYLALIGQEHVQGIVKLMCVLLSEADITSNPYMAANYIELVFYLLHDSKTGIISEVFRTSEVAHRNLTYGLIRFYCDIAVTGSSHQFYSKFKYRFYVNKIFVALWTHEAFRNNLTSYFHKPVFEKFLNMVMTDTTYCFDESNQNYQKYKALEAKKQTGPLSPEEQKSQEQISTIISSTLNQSTSNVKLMRELSAWSPNTFLSEAERSTLVPLLNSMLKTLVDPTTFSANRQLINKYKFEKESFLSDLLQIYVNLDINEKLSNQIVKDARNYKKEYFSKALQKASNEHYTSIETLESVEQLISKLSTAINEEEADQIYGEIPQKYLCSLMSTLMKDPVLLPGSGNIVERVNIHRSLLIDERDPFTRAPLKANELQQMKELREEIEGWKRMRLEVLKQGGKEVKYGNIGANKKDSLEGEEKFGRLNYEPEGDD